MEAKLAELDEVLRDVLAGGGERYVQRHKDRGKLGIRERIELLLDRDAPFLELQPFVAYGTDYKVGGSMVAGIGPVEGVECVIGGADPTVKGGTSNPHTWRKALRMMEVAEQNRMPMVQMVESGGADLRTQAEGFIPGGETFRNITRLSAWASPRWRWCSATRPPAAPTCPACPTTTSSSASGPRCSWAARRW